MLPVIRIEAVQEYKSCTIVVYTKVTGVKPPSLNRDMERLQVLVKDGEKITIIPSKELFWSTVPAICAGQRIINRWHEYIQSSPN